MHDRILHSKFTAKFIGDFGKIKPQEWPKTFHTTKTYTNLGSLIKTENRILAVDQALKDIIEKLEPDMHQFSPINIVMPKGKEYPKQYYVMVISQFLDSFSPTESEEGVWRDNSYEAHWGEKIIKYQVELPKKQYFSGLAMKSDVFKKSHLWREQKLNDPHLYISDEMANEIRNEGLRVTGIYQLKKV